jgi:hypothetical protein
MFEDFSMKLAFFVLMGGYYCIYRSQPETEMSCTVGDGDVLYGWRRRCLVWPEAEMSGIAGDGDVFYGRSW